MGRQTCRAVLRGLRLWGASGGLLRGLFEYDYRADRLRVRPHLPANVTRYAQKFPVWFGKTRIYLTVTGNGTCDWTELRPSGKPEVLAVEIVRGDAKPQGAWKPDAAAPLTLPDDPDVWKCQAYAWPPPTSGNHNPLRIGTSPNGGYHFAGEIRAVRIYRRPLSETEIAALTQGRVVAGAAQPAAGSRRPAAVGRAARGELFWSTRPVRDLDFRENFTLAAEIRPAALADSARLIDRTTVGTMDGYLLDYLQNGKVLRLLTPWGIAEGPVNLQTGRWQQVAATCTADGLMRVYLNGTKIAETQGKKPETLPLAMEPPVDLQKVAAFYRAMIQRRFTGQLRGGRVADCIATAHRPAPRDCKIRHPCPIWEPFQRATGKPSMNCTSTPQVGSPAAWWTGWPAGISGSGASRRKL